MVPISPEIYSSTAVVMDNRSLADYIQRLEDRRLKRAAAEQEAFDAWNEANEKSLNPSNMRNQELGKFNEGLQEYRTLAIEARKNPKDYTRRLAAQKKADELLALARASKNAKEVDKEYTTLLRNTLNNPEARKTTDYQRILQDKSIHDLPIGFKAGGVMGIPEMRRPEDTAPKMDYYKPPPIDVVKLFDENKSGIEFDERISPTDKDFFYKIGYSPESIKAIAERFADRVQGDSNLFSSYKVKGQQLSPDQAAQMTATVKKYFPNMEVDDDDPVSVAVADAVIEAEKRKKRAIDQKELKKYGSTLVVRGAGGMGGGQIQVTGNAFDEITNIKGIKKGVDVQDGVALLNSKPYNGKVVVLGEELPLSVVAPLKSAGLKISQKDKVDVVFQNGKVISIKPIGKSAVSKTMMENAQLKYSTEPQKGPQMIFGKPSGGGGAYLGVDENGNPIFED